MSEQEQSIEEVRKRFIESKLWVFGYGSLMWNPGFHYAYNTLARSHGYHRDFAMRSVRHRGTPDMPGLVLTLCPGGSCVGRAFKVPPKDAMRVYDYLIEREISTYAYKPALIKIVVDSHSVAALTFVPKLGAAEFTPGKSLDQQAEIIAQAHGGMGTNRDYLTNTNEQLKALGLTNKRFQALEQKVLSLG